MESWGAPEVGCVVLGLLLSVVGLLLAPEGTGSLASRFIGGIDSARLRREGRLALSLGATVFVSVPVVWDFATSGLESGLVLAWLGGAFWLLVRSRPMTLRGARLAAFAIGCGPLVRPDLTLFSLSFGAALALIVRTVSDRRFTRRQWIGLGIIEAARVLECGELALLLLRAVGSPLTLSRFFATVRAAWPLRRLRIPFTPAAARERFCTPPASGSRP